MIALTSYATPEFVEAQLGLVQSALRQGADRVTMWRSEHLRATAFYRKNREILDRPRGAGYWLWKPYIILTELEQLNVGDYLIYHDCGHPDKPNTIKRPLKHAVRWCHNHLGGILPGVYLPEYGRNARWTKGECFSAMGCDAAVYREHPQIQASFSVWEKHDASIEFVREWLRWCADPMALVDDRLDPDILDDADFVEHRHDQSVLTLVTIKRGRTCMGSPLERHPGARTINGLIDRITGVAAPESFAHKLPNFARNFPEMVGA